MIVHRLLDAFFRTLDTVDAVRDRVDRALGREPRPDPWAVEWPPPGEEFDTPPTDDSAQASAEERTTPEPSASDDGSQGGTARKTKKVAKASSPKGEKAKSKPGDAGATQGGDAAKKKPGRKKKSSSKRKGSVDRSGKDLTSERADIVIAHIQDGDRAKVSEEADLNGKKVLARVVWALSEAHAAGVDVGLTTNDVAALLSKAADIEVFATNIGRACRDHPTLIAESKPDGRSKRYILTDDGKKAAADIVTA